MTPTIAVEVGAARRSVPIQGVIDTGFSGYVCVPIDLAVTLGLELAGVRLVELADGSQKRELFFAGVARLEGVWRDVEMYLTEGEAALIGTRLRADCRLTIDFPKNKVHLTRGRRGR